MAERVSVSTKELAKKVTALMHNQHFLIAVAEACDKAYNEGVGNKDTALFSDAEKDILFGRAAADPEEFEKVDEKLDRNLAGFYATQETIFLMGEMWGKDPKNVLENMASENPDKVIMVTAQRLAHATWLTGAAFRNRSLRENVMVYDELPVKEQEKDRVQIQTSAKILLKHLD